MMAELRARHSRLARGGPPSGGAAINDPGSGRRSDSRLADAARLDRLRLVEDAVSAGISRGIGHLIAEDEHLSGRFVTLRGSRQVNFGSCSYLGLETDLRLKNAACDAVNRFGV